MDDEQLRELLGRYRPVGPEATLRERVLSLPGRPTSAWPWAAAAAALIAVTFGVHVATNRAAAREAPGPAVDSEEALAAALGGDEEARSAARVIVAEQTFRTWLAGGAGHDTIEELLNGVN